MADIYDSLNAKQLRVAQKIKRAAKEVGVDPHVLLAMAMQESGFDQNKISKTGPVGVGQIGAKAAIDAGIKDRYNEDQNIIAMARYYKQNLDRNKGNVHAAIIDYHDGPGTFKKGNASPEATEHVGKVFGYIPQFGGTVPSTVATTGSSLPAIKRANAAEADSAGTGSMYDIGDVLAGTAGTIGGTLFSSHSPRSAASVANQLRLQGQKQGEIDATNKMREREFRAEEAKYNDAMELRNKAIQAATEQQAPHSLDQYTNKMLKPGSSNVITSNPLIVTQTGAQGEVPKVQSNLQRASTLDPMATNIDPRTGLSLPFGTPMSTPPPPVESHFPMPKRPVLETVPPAPVKEPYMGSHKGRIGTGFGTGLAALQGSNAIRRAEEGDVIGATLGGASALGGAGTQLRNPKAAMASGLFGAATAGAQQLYDYLREGASNLTGDTGIPPIDNYIKSMRAQQEADKEVTHKAAGGLTDLPKYAGRNPKGQLVGEGIKKVEDLIGRAPSGAGSIMANRYPLTAPPALAIDKKTGKEFLQKQNSPEAMMVEAIRKQAQKDIDKGNYTPFFDVSKRFHVDPANYPLQGSTITQAMPKKQATIDKWRAEFDTPEVHGRLSEAFNKAKGDPLTWNWYAMGQLENEYVKRLGPEAGRKAFRESFAEPMAATTGGADPTSNLLMSYYGNYLKKQGMPMPAAAYEMPYPIGGRYASGNMAMYDKVMNQGAGLTPATPKRFNFAADFMGHMDRPTIDEQMSGLYKPGMVVPPGDSYGITEQVLNDVARQHGVSPVNFQEVAWAGAKGTKGKPMIQHVNEAIERTSRVTGMTPEQVVERSLVQRTSPLYGGAAGVGLGASQMEEKARGGLTGL